MEPFIGQVILFAGNFAPRGWAFCAGQLLPISQYQALFSLLGTTYGGDGRTTFALPDLRGRVPRGDEGGAGPGLPQVRSGEKGGATEHTLTADQLPAHAHGLNNNAIDTEADGNSPVGHNLANTAENSYSASTATGISGPASTKTDGGQSHAFSTMDPYLGMNYIIALEGTYPSRS